MGINFATIVYLISSFCLNDPGCFLPSFEESGAAYTIFKDFPSFGTLAFFFLFGIGYLVKSKAFGVVLMVGASIALIGYVFSLPILYYHHEALSTGMAFNTATLFFLMGLWLFDRTQGQLKFKT